jgi:hypothetical protein
VPATPYSYRQYAGNGSTTTFSVPFPFLLRAHVKVYLGYDLLAGTYTSELTPGTGFNWNSDTQIQTVTAPANGTTLTVIRETPTDQLLVQWQDGSNLISENLLTSDKQNLYVTQEQEDIVFASSALATTAATNAATALSTANAASTTANGIAGTANTALTNANAAVVTANAASSTATAAQTTANGIAGTANTALTNANAAVVTANAADATANGIAGTANTALTNANAAVATANAADATANGIAATANTALSNSSAAVSTANAALPKAGGTMTGAITFAGAQPTATTSAAAIVQLSSSTSSTSETLAATPKAVKDAYDLANAALPKAGGTMTGVITYAAAQPRLVMETVKTTTSGADVPFTSIPSWAKRITLSLSGVSTNGTSLVILQLGDSGGYEATGYNGATSVIITTPGASFNGAAHSTGFNLIGGPASAASVDLHGILTLTLVDGSTNTWACSGNLARTDLVISQFVAGTKSLSATLDRLRITTAGGTNTFDAGTANILYEG